ncbi:hypothetical protein LOZ66_004742 [Ophidiomyces ophidiicola]|nr:hypothetical protein LOZ66_004742 [Ophidiomyces ophidiicola]
MKGILWPKAQLRKSRYSNPWIAPCRRTASITSVPDGQTLTLPDSRLLGFAEFGSPSGYPVFFFHGFPASRFEAQAIDQLARAHQLRLISPDRPGFGLSTLQPGRRIVDWPADVQALAQHLGLSRFAILGGSGGGPYALACALRLPHEMMSAVGLMASAGPWKAGTHDLAVSRRITSWLATNRPGALVRLSDLFVTVSKKIIATRQVTRLIDNMIRRANGMEGSSGRDDGSSALVEAQRKLIFSAVFEAFAQGSAGVVQDARLLTNDWGFEFEDVTYDRIQVWHGTKDKNSPVRAIRYMVERLPHGDLCEFEGDNHYALAHHTERILAELVPEEEKAVFNGSRGPMV